MDTPNSEVRSQESEHALGRELIEKAMASVQEKQNAENNAESVVDDQPEVILYDANAQQRIPFRFDDGNASVEVVFVLDAQTDEALAEYDRLKNERYVAADQEETGDPGAMESSDETTRAAVWLLNDRLLDVEGFGDEGEDKPENWKDLVFDDDSDREAVIDDGYLAAQVVPAPLAPKGTRLAWKRAPRKDVINLIAAFNGRQVRLTHERTIAVTADHVTEFKSIRKSRYLVTGTKLGANEIKIPPKARRLAALYDALQYKATGYAGRVPLHHKGLVVLHDLGGKGAQAVRKN